ncbi:MAG: hypothetical protein MR883_07285 [Clostridiales bacterium]|nr:hypothetical protein [Clostridiales bacterium]
MTDKQFYTCVSEVDSYQDRDAYISDMALSSMWEDDKTDEIPAERLDAVSQIWDAAHRSVKQIAADAGMSQRKLAERFCIPYRTMENWGGGKNACPLYIRLMMQEILGLLQMS